MMKNTVLNTICRVVLIGLMLLTPMAAMADPYSITWSYPISEDRIEQSMIPYVYEFWNLAWDLDFILGQSGMLLEDSGTEAWQVLVTEAGTEDYVAEGSFTEADRLLLESMASTQEELDEAGIISYDHYIVVRSITGSTGFESALYGFAIEVVYPGENPEDDPIVAHVFTPLALADDVTSAVAMAYDYWVSFESPCLFLNVASLWYGWDSHGWEPHQAMAGDRDCGKEYELCMEAAWERCQADRGDILAQTLVIVGGCPLALDPSTLFACSVAKQVPSRNKLSGSIIRRIALIVRGINWHVRLTVSLNQT